MTYETGLGAKLALGGVLEFRDDAGNILKTMEFHGSVPLSDLGLTVEQAQTLIDQQESQHGPDHC